MTAAQWLLTILACLVGLGSIAFAYVVQLANAMKTTAPPLSTRDALIAVAPAVLCIGLLVVEYVLARRSANLSRVLWWNSPAIIGAAIALLMVVAGWATDRPGARRAASARLRATEQKRNTDLWQNSGWLRDYDLRVERGIQTVLTNSSGKEQPGVDWHVSFKVDGLVQTAALHSFAVEGQAIDLAQHSRHVLQHLKEKLDGGWRPKPSEAPFEVVIGND